MVIHVLFQLVLLFGVVGGLFLVNKGLGKVVKINSLRLIIKLFLSLILLFIYFKILNITHNYILNTMIYEKGNFRALNIITNSQFLYPLLLWAVTMYIGFNSIITYKMENSIKSLDFAIDYVLLALTIIIAFISNYEGGFILFDILFILMIIIKYFLHKNELNKLINNSILYIIFMWIYTFTIYFIILNSSFLLGVNRIHPVYINGFFVIIMVIILYALKMHFYKNTSNKNKKDFMIFKVAVLSGFIFFCSGTLYNYYDQNTIENIFMAEIYPDNLDEYDANNKYSASQLVLEDFYLKDLTIFDGARGLDSINYLSLSDNNLTSLDGLENFKNLDTLIVTDNKLKEVVDVDFSGIETVDLSNNYIEKIEPSSVEGVKEFRIDQQSNNMNLDINALNGVEKIYIDLDDVKPNLSDDFDPYIISPYEDSNDLYKNRIDIGIFNYFWDYRNNIVFDNSKDEIDVYYNDYEDFNIVDLKFELKDYQEEQRTYKITNNSSDTFKIDYPSPATKNGLFSDGSEALSVTLKPDESETITVGANKIITIYMNNKYLITLKEWGHA